MFDMQQYVQKYVQVLEWLDGDVIDRMADVLVEAWRTRRRVFSCGNGGSAANACHFAADLTKLTAPPHGPRLRAVSLAESLSAISAIGNDLAYDEIFAEQLRGSMDAGDILIGLSTSGSSPNVLRAIDYANECGAVTLGITGQRGHLLQAHAQLTLAVASDSVQHVEDATMVALHLLCLKTQVQIRREFEKQSGARPELTAAGRPAVARVAAAPVVSGGAPSFS
jgi:D-sedoheptulose 7-phosphate isomerase